MFFEYYEVIKYCLGVINSNKALRMGMIKSIIKPYKELITLDRIWSSHDTQRMIPHSLGIAHIYILMVLTKMGL